MVCTPAALADFLFSLSFPTYPGRYTIVALKLPECFPISIVTIFEVERALPNLVKVVLQLLNNQGVLNFQPNLVICWATWITV